MGFFTGLDEEKYDRQYSDRELVRRMASYFIPFGKQLIWVWVLVLLIAGAGAATPVLVARGLDVLGARPALSLILLLSGAILLFGLVTWVANWFRRRILVRMIGGIVLALRTQAFDAAAAHDLSFYDEFASGKVVSRITSDTQDFGATVVLVTDIFSQIIQTIILSVVLIGIDWRLTLMLFAFLPLLFGVAIGLRRLAREVTRTGMRAIANVNAAIKETVSGISVAKNFRQEGEVYDEFSAANKQSYSVNVRRGLVLSMVFPALNALGGVATAILIYVGGLSVLQGVVTAGAWFLFLQSLDRFFFPVLNLSAFWTQVQSGLSAAERVFALMDAEPRVTQTGNVKIGRVKEVSPHPGPLPRGEGASLRGDIRFEHVYFSYDNTDEHVLEDFSLHIHPGETVALVGHTGAGKSSIAKLIARFYEFQEGRILVDGVDIRTLDLQDYRRHLGIVSQTPFLFSGTVLENICYACNDLERALRGEDFSLYQGSTNEIATEVATTKGRAASPAASSGMLTFGVVETPPSANGILDDIEALARRIGEGEWLETLPNGLMTEVGERGARLSMGQRQLVSLMRVLVQRPEIFILDEATASIDPFTEWQIQQALNLILADTTSILIAHRLSTVKAADRIIVLQKGKIIEEGDHERLLAQGGHYAELYNTYFRHQSVDYRPEEEAGD